MNACDRREDLGPFVLGSLPTEEERAQVEAHVATCQSCRRELVELEGLPALLGLASDAAPRPPERVRDRVLAAAVSRRTNRRWAGVAAAVAMLGALLGGAATFQLTASTPAVAVGLTAVEPFDPAGSALLEETRRGVVIELEVRDLPPLPPGEVYEAWLSTQDEELVSLGHLRPDGAGSVAVRLRAAGRLGEYRSFWVTAEPDRSSAHAGPTVVYARLPALEW